jgi:acetyl esterase
VTAPPRLDRRIRWFARALGRLPGADVVRMTPADIARANARRVPRNAVVDFICGPLAPEVRRENRRIPGPVEDIPIRVYRPLRPGGPRPVVLHFHGGGFTLGNLEMGGWLCSRLALGADVVVVDVHYRLAPAAPFPAAVDDCWAAVCWAAEHAARIGGDPDDVSVTGESAGGNLAAVMCLLDREAGGRLIRKQSLMYPALDLTGTSPSLREIGDQPFARIEALQALLGHYLGPERSAAGDWRASPLLAADFAGLPPALILVAGFDPLRDDGVRYAEALGAAGGEVTLRHFPTMPHAFLNFPVLCRAAEVGMAELVAFHRGTR